MTEDEGPVSGGPTVDVVTGQLTTRLGAAGESAGEVMRRDVRDAAGGAETIALLVQADVAGVQPMAVDDDPAAPVDEPAWPNEAGVAEHHFAAGDLPAPGAPQPDPAPPGENDDAVGQRPAPGPAASPSAGADGPQVGPIPDAGSPPREPDTADSAPKPAEPPAQTPPPPSDDPPPPGDDPRTSDNDRVSGEPAAGAGQTPWTAAQPIMGADPGAGQAPGSTPWTSGAGSAMPYSGMPGGMPNFPAPQERPARGGAPWSRARADKNADRDGTVYPRPGSRRGSSTAYPLGRPQD